MDKKSFIKFLQSILKDEIIGFVEYDERADALLVRFPTSLSFKINVECL